MYNGNPKYEPGAIVARLAPNFIRFGSFELPASRDQKTALKELTDACIAHYFPEIKYKGPKAYEAFFEEVCKRTASLIIHWQRVGFVHGVLNTDNMSILGLTIDYGPYGWLEPYDPDWTPNTTAQVPFWQSVPGRAMESIPASQCPLPYSRRDYCFGGWLRRL
jgi:uncharacterized protein YdiU (UPF0061 family)